MRLFEVLNKPTKKTYNGSLTGVGANITDLQTFGVNGKVLTKGTILVKCQTGSLVGAIVEVYGKIGGIDFYLETLLQSATLNPGEIATFSIQGPWDAIILRGKNATGGAKDSTNIEWRGIILAE